MKILVCIKPDMAGREIGPFEHLALEAGLVLRDSCRSLGMADSRVDVVTAGPKSWEEGIVRALGMGADQGIHLLTPENEWAAHCPGLVPASRTSARLSRIPDLSSYDLILTGILSQDLMAGQTGPMLAERLRLPCVTAVTQLILPDPVTESDPEPVTAPGTFLFAIREMEGGLAEEVRITLPALVSIQSGTYTPRYPVLSHMLKAREKPFRQIPAVDPSSGPEIFSDPVQPDKTRAGTCITGPIDHQVDAFIAFMQERGLS